MKVYNKPCFIRLCDEDVIARLKAIGQRQWRESYRRPDAICASIPLYPVNKSDSTLNNGLFLYIRLDVCENFLKTGKYIDCGTDIELFIKTASSKE